MVIKSARIAPSKFKRLQNFSVWKQIKIHPAILYSRICLRLWDLEIRWKEIFAGYPWWCWSADLHRCGIHSIIKRSLNDLAIYFEGVFDRSNVGREIGSTILVRFEGRTMVYFSSKFIFIIRLDSLPDKKSILFRKCWPNLWPSTLYQLPALLNAHVSRLLYKKKH